VHDPEIDEDAAILGRQHLGLHVLGPRLLVEFLLGQGLGQVRVVAGFHLFPAEFDDRGEVLGRLRMVALAHESSAQTAGRLHMFRAHAHDGLQARDGLFPLLVGQELGRRLVGQVGLLHLAR